MTLGKVKHFLRGLVVGFVASLILAVIAYNLVVVAAAFWLWVPVEFGLGSWRLWRGLALAAALGAVLFAGSKDWWSDYQCNTKEENK